MLEKIRDGSQGVVAKAILVVVILSFALAGIGSYLGGSTDVAGAIVNGKTITGAQVEQEFQQERNRMQQQFGEMFQAIANDETYMASVRKNVLDRLVSQELLLQTATKMDLRVGDEEIKQAIRDMQEFHVDGVFNNDRYQSLLRQSGYRVEQFRDMLRTDMTRRQLIATLVSSDFTLANEANVIAKLEQQMRDIRYIEVKASDFLDSVAVTSEEINDYYELNNGQFQTQETLSLEYVELKVSDLMDKVSVEDAKVEETYQENITQYQTDARRRVSHILFEFGDDEAASQAAAQAALAQLNGGADFAALAKEVSQDAFSAENGGDLDWIEPGIMDPEFDKAAFALAKGETSQVVRSEFGFHILNVTDAEDVTTKPLSEVQESIKQELLTEAAKELFYEMQQQLADIAFEVPENLIEAAESIDSTVKSTELFTRATAPEFVKAPAVLNAAFSDPVLLEAVNSDVIEITPDHLLVLRKKEHNPSEIKALELVTADIEQRLKAEKAQAQAKEKAQEYLDAWNNNQEIADVTVSEKSALLRTSRDLDPAIVAAAFKLGKPTTDKVANELVTTAAGEAIVSLIKVTEAADVAENVEGIIERMQRSNSDATYRAFIQSLKDASDIQYPQA